MTLHPAAAQYDEVEALLAAADIDEHPAAVHGALCSIVCIYGGHGLSVWTGQVLDTGAGTADAGPELSERLQALYTATHRSLEGASLSFELLLPPDSSPVADRAEALANWAGGFLHGLGAGADIGGVRERLAAEPLHEIVDDLVAISRAADDSEADESTDTAFAEIVEYLRVITQLVYEELTPAREAANHDGVVH